MKRRVFLGRAVHGVVRAAVAAGSAGLVLPRNGWARTPSSAPVPRALSFYHTHTGERLNVRYHDGARHLPDPLAEIDRFLGDFRTGEVHPIDPALLDLLWSLQRRTGADGPFEVISGYRSPRTNARLRRRGGGGVARRSLHMSGRAIDVRIADLASDRLRDAALALRQGGVGYYRSAGFVHLDTGPTRRWTG